jgi:hypothetical protein
VGESVMIRTQMGTHNRSETVAMHGAPCSIPPRNSNSRSEGQEGHDLHYQRFTRFPLKLKHVLFYKTKLKLLFKLILIVSRAQRFV